MSVFSSAANAITSIFDTIGEVGETAQKTVQMGARFVHNRALRQTIVDREAVMIDTAQDLAKLQKELERDEDVKAIFDKLEKEWD